MENYLIEFFVGLALFISSIVFSVKYNDKIKPGKWYSYVFFCLNYLGIIFIFYYVGRLLGYKRHDLLYYGGLMVFMVIASTISNIIIKNIIKWKQKNSLTITESTNSSDDKESSDEY